MTSQGHLWVVETRSGLPAGTNLGEAGHAVGVVGSACIGRLLRRVDHYLQGCRAGGFEDALDGDAVLPDVASHNLYQSRVRKRLRLCVWGHSRAAYPGASWLCSLAHQSVQSLQRFCIVTPGGRCAL